MFQNVDNEGKAGRFYILPMLKKMCKMEVEQDDFRFYRCSKKYGNLKSNRNVLDFSDA